MRNLILFLIVLLPAALCAQVDVRAPGSVTVVAQPSTAGTTYALVIGISKYKEVANLKFADKDAASFAGYLVARSGMALDPKNVKMYLNDSATLTNVTNTFTDFLKATKKGDKIIFYFAGHGDYDANPASLNRDEALLLLYGSPKSNYFENNVFGVGGDYLQMSMLTKALNIFSSKGVDVLLIVDACHAMGMDGKLSGGADGGKVTAKVLEDLPSPTKLYASKSDQFSLEGKEFGGGHGLFTYFLLQGLYGIADKDMNKSITGIEMLNYLLSEVPQKAMPSNQTPNVVMTDYMKEFGKVNDSLYKVALAAQKNGFGFMDLVATKGSDDFLLRNMDSLSREMYEQCISLIDNKMLDSAYLLFKVLNAADSTNDAVIRLRRNLSAAYQQKAAVILTPMLEDVYNFTCKQSDIQHAESDMAKAAELLGESHFLYKSLQGRILFLKGLEIQVSKDTARSKEAVAFLEESASLDPNSPYTYFFLGQFYRYKDKIKARDNFEKYVGLIPHSCWANNALGYVYLELGNYADAERMIKKALELKPDYTNAMNNLANVYKAQGRNAEANGYYWKALDRNPKYFTAWTNLAISYHSTHSFDSAAICYTKALEIKPEAKTPFNYYLCQVYSQLKKYPSALEYLEKAIKSKRSPSGNMLNDIATDMELNNLRTQRDFKTLLGKYFSKEDMDQYPGLFVISR